MSIAPFSFPNLSRKFSVIQKTKLNCRVGHLRLLFGAAMLASLTACGGGGDAPGSPADAAPAPGPTAPAPTSSELPFVFDRARRAAYKRVFSPLLSGTYDRFCSTTASGQLADGGGPINVDEAGARASTAAGGLDLLADGSALFEFARFYQRSMGVTGFGKIVYRTNSNDTQFYAEARIDELDGPVGFAGLTGNAGGVVTAACAGAAPRIASADLFGLIRGFLPDRPVRMLDCLATANGAIVGRVNAGEVSIGARDISVNGDRIGVDDAGKLSDAVLIHDRGGVGTLEYIAQWQDRLLSISFDDAGNVHSAQLADIGSAQRSVSCKRPAR
jgi:hypothetical protein